ncbi:MAG: PLP-dependent cysteine synthase family protein [Candidatus Bathyarchaeia archaeon]
MRVVDDVLKLIGDTPMVKLKSVRKSAGAGVYVKLEYLNPSGSLKDRIALEMIRKAEADGKLKPGYTIVEASTGNTGISLSFVGSHLGYKVVIYMPEGMTQERIKIMESYGAEVCLVKPGDLKALEKGVAGAEVEIPTRMMCLERERSDPKVWWARQFQNPANIEAHIKTGREILRQLDGKVDAFAASIGTGGTLLGIAKALKDELPNVKVIGIEPASAKYPIVSGYKKVPGAGEEVSGGIVAELFDSGLIDEFVSVTNDDAIDMANRLLSEEGLFTGVSAGANVLVACRVSKRLGGNKRVATVLPDSRDRYLTEMKYTT